MAEHIYTRQPEITLVQLLYLNNQITAENKVPADGYFRIVVEASASEYIDIVAFIPLGSTGLITADGKKFYCKMDDQSIDYHSKFTGEEIDRLLQNVKDKSLQKGVTNG